eukprot:scaffold57293_cov16-Tisochrysis_lutea.AAC.3
MSRISRKEECRGAKAGICVCAWVHACGCMLAHAINTERCRLDLGIILAMQPDTQPDNLPPCINS